MEETIKEFNSWCVLNDINLKLSNQYFTVGDKTAVLLEDQENILNEDMTITSDIKDRDLFVFKFGDEFFYKTSTKDTELNLFTCLGNTSASPFPHIGIGDEYSIDGTVGTISQYIEKAKFLGAKTVGYTGLNSMNGSFTFQQEAEKNDMKTCHGLRLTMSIDSITTEVLLYAKNSDSIPNLIRICNEKNLSFSGEPIPFESIKEWLDGIVWIWNVEGYMQKASFDQFIETNELILRLTKNKTFARIHTTQYADKERDDKYLNSLVKYRDYYRDTIEPILIEHPQVVHPSHFMAPIYMRKIISISDQFQTNPHLKSIEQSRKDISDVLKDMSLFDDAMNNTISLSEIIESRIDDKTQKLPAFEIDSDVAKSIGYDGDFNDTKAIFKHIIKKAFFAKVTGDQKIYKERIRYESGVILKHNLQDYFLILWDIIRWCESQDILCGIGRGSAGGSLISYLMGITKLDPIPYGLIFERFLNEGRLPKKIKEKMFVFDIDDAHLYLYQNVVIDVLRGGNAIKINTNDIKQGDEILLQSLRENQGFIRNGQAEEQKNITM